MYYKFKYYTIFRNYGEIGYLIYQKSPFDVDRVVNKIGAAFLAELSYEPKSIEVLALLAAGRTTTQRAAKNDQFWAN